MILQSIYYANLVKSIVWLLASIIRLVKMQISEYIRYPDSKNYWYPN